MNTRIELSQPSSSQNISQIGKKDDDKSIDSLFSSIMGQVKSTMQQEGTTTVEDTPSLKGLVEELFQQLSVEEKQLVGGLIEQLKEKMGQSENDEEAAYMLLANMILQPQAITALVGHSEQEDAISKQLVDKLIPLLEKLSVQKEATDVKKVVEKWIQNKDGWKTSYLQNVLERVFPKEVKDVGISILPTQSLPIYQPTEAINVGLVPQVGGKVFALYAGMNGSKMNEQQFIRDFQHILMNSNFTSANGIQKLSIKLYPEHLGSVHVDIVKRGGEMIAKIVASSTSAKDVLESHVQQLRAAFVSQNISVDKVEIASYLQQWKEHQQDSQSAYEEQQKSKSKTVDGDEENKASFFEELTNLKV
jgi:hypothetical protein